jgi:hypothetical protein
MAKRLNDTAALVESPPMQGGQEHSIRVKKIDNGYLICTSEYNPDTGVYKSREEFSARPPRIMPGRVAFGRIDPGNPLADAMRYMGDDGGNKQAR